MPEVEASEMGFGIGTDFTSEDLNESNLKQDYEPEPQEPEGQEFVEHVQPEVKAGGTQLV